MVQSYDWSSSLSVSISVPFFFFPLNATTASFMFSQREFKVLKSSFMMLLEYRHHHAIIGHGRPGQWVTNFYPNLDQASLL